MMKYVRSNTIVISVNNSIFIGEDYDFSEAEERELSEKLNEIEKDISKDDKIADDTTSVYNVIVMFKTATASIVVFVYIWKINRPVNMFSH